MLLRCAVRLAVRRLASGVVLDGTLNPRHSDFLLEGTATTPDGRVFRGSFDELKGFPLSGSQVEEDGDLYKGEFNEQWQRHGRGEAWLADGTYYKGIFSEDELTEGTVRIPNGTTETVYEGTLRDESFVQGKLTQHDFTYEGEFRDNVPHGRGRLVFSTGAEQEGTFHAGKLHGSGCKMKLDGGFVYVGEFFDGSIRRGQLFTPTYTYDGEFNENGRAHGEGTQTYLANEPRLLFTGVWENGALVRGTCRDEYGAPVDWQENHDIQSKVFSDDGGASAVAMNSYSVARLREADAMHREMNQSYQQDAASVANKTGRVPSKMDLGYEGGLQQENEAFTKASQQNVKDMQHTRKEIESRSEDISRVCASVMGEVPLELNLSAARMQCARQDGAQQLATERIDEQFERFMKNFDRKSSDGSSRLLIDGKRGDMIGLEGHTATLYGDSIIVVGGKKAAFDLNDTVFSLNLTTCEWQPLLCDGEAPLARSYHTACLYGTRLIITGGLTSIGVHDIHYNTYNVFTASDGLDDGTLRQMGPARLRPPSQLRPLVPQCLEPRGAVYALDLALSPPRWEALQPEGPAPPPRTHHTAAVHGDTMYILGGYNVHGLQTYVAVDEMDCVFCLDLRSMRWLTLSLSVPLHYWGASLTPIGGGLFCHFGGVSRTENRESRDTALVDVRTGAVLLVPETASAPLPRAAHCAFRWGGDVFIFGGAGSIATRFYNDVTRFDVQRRCWQTVVTGGDVPPPLSGAAVVVVGTHVLLIGGIRPNFSRRADVVYRLCLRSFQWKQSETAEAAQLCRSALHVAMANSAAVSRGAQTEHFYVCGEHRGAYIERTIDELDAFANMNVSRRVLNREDSAGEERSHTPEVFDRWTRELKNLRTLGEQWRSTVDAGHVGVELLRELPQQKIRWT